MQRLVEPGQYLCVRYSERLDDNDIVASVGSKGDSYDCEYPWVGDRFLGGSSQLLSRAV
jgi:hypothetical protein